MAEMDIRQAFSLLVEQIKKMESCDIATRIVGYLLMNYGEEEMIKLAHSSVQSIEKAVLLSKNKLRQLLANPPSLPSLFDIPPGFNQCSQLTSTVNTTSVGALAELQNKARSMSLMDHYDQEQGGLSVGNICGQKSCSSSFSTMPCIYFNDSCCMNGNSCRCSHEQTSPVSLSPLVDPSMSQFVDDEHMYLHGSIERLEMEIAELLKERGGEPIQIANLPMLYSMFYHKPLQAEGYMTESQRNGRPGYGLTKLLGRMKNSICLIDRPNGQDSIILAEDIAKYFECRSLRNSPGPMFTASQQIFLTFPPESTFTEDDVAEYFSKFGKVENVRMPSKQERNFGFVAFSSPRTVKTILSQRNDHFVAGSRVLVKPYREKSKLPERRDTDHLLYYRHQYADTNSEFLSTPIGVEAAEFLEQQLQQQRIKHYVQSFERQRLMEPLIARNTELPLVSGQHDCMPNFTNNKFPNNDAANHLVTDNTALDGSAGEVLLPDSLCSSPS